MPCTEKAKLEYLLQKDPNDVLSGQPGGHQHGHRDGGGMWLRELKPPDDRVGRTQRSQSWQQLLFRHVDGLTPAYMEQHPLRAWNRAHAAHSGPNTPTRHNANDSQAQNWCAQQSVPGSASGRVLHLA
jgi:hypothetical protein